MKNPKRFADTDEWLPPKKSRTEKIPEISSEKSRQLIQLGDYEVFGEDVFLTPFVKYSDLQNEKKYKSQLTFGKTAILTEMLKPSPSYDLLIVESLAEFLDTVEAADMISNFPFLEICKTQWLLLIKRRFSYDIFITAKEHVENPREFERLTKSRESFHENIKDASKEMKMFYSMCSEKADYFRTASTLSTSSVKYLNFRAKIEKLDTFKVLTKLCK